MGWFALLWLTLFPELQQVQLRDGWSTWTETVVTSPPGLHVVHRRYRVFRRHGLGPVELVLDQPPTSGGVEVTLGPRGILFIQQLGTGLLARPGRPPFRPPAPFPVRRMRNAWGDVWFLGDVLFYGRFPAIERYQVGFIDLTTGRQGVCLVVEGEEEGWQAQVGQSPMRVLDRVFWIERDSHEVHDCAL